MSETPATQTNWNVPNALTILRILLVPLFGIASAALALGERLAPSTLAASALVLAGLALIVFRLGPPARVTHRTV